MMDIESWLKAYREGTSPRECLLDLVEQIRTSDNSETWIHRMEPADLEPYFQRLEASSPGDLPLYGVPFAIKDNIDLADVPTTAACPAYAYVPEHSAFVVEKLIQSGAVPLGKTNLDQFATGLVGTRSPYGVPRNPFAPNRVPGGSSSGSAVAVAEGRVAFALGTDTAGSGRIPAAFNGVWGLKPSRGRLSTGGVVPACRTLDCVSIFAGSADDCRRVLQVAEGYDEADAYSQALANVPLSGSRTIGVPRAEQLMFFGDAGYADAWTAAVKDLQGKAWSVREIDFQPFLEAARLLYEGPWVAERYTALETFLNQSPEAFYPVTRRIIEGGAGASARDAFAAIYRLAELRRKADQVFRGLDAIVTPTAGGFPTLTEVEADPLGPNSQLGYYTNFMNLLDLCAVAVPAGEAPTGLPFGLTWIAPRDGDIALLAAAGEFSPDQKRDPDEIDLVLFGAHMEGLPLNPQVRGLGARFAGAVSTAATYRMVRLSEPAPARPGVVRVGEGGASLEGELWSFPKKALGAFLATIHQPLGLGELELADGSRAHGFLCEATGAEGKEDITRCGGWRSHLKNGAA